MDAQYPVDRSCKRASIIVCISPNGIVCLPQFSIEERTTIDRKLNEYVSEDSIQIVDTDSNTKSFFYWLNEKFLPELHILRQKYNYYEKAVIINIDLLAHKNACDSINLEKEN